MRAGAAVLASALFLSAACSGDDAGGQSTGATDAPRRTGPATQIAAGDGWRLRAQESTSGTCLELVANGESATGCGFGVPELRLVGYFAATLKSERFLAGPVDKDATEVVVELEGDASVRTEAVPTDGDTDVFVARVPEGRPHRVVALGANGEELDAVATPPDPW